MGTVEHLHAVGDSYIEAGIQGVYAHCDILVAPAVLEGAGVEYAFGHPVGCLLELRELAQSALGETEVAAPANHAGEHQVQFLVEIGGFLPCLDGTGYHAEVGVVERCSRVEVVHVGRKQVGRRRGEPGYDRVRTGTEHERVPGEQFFVFLEEFPAYGGAVPVHEHDGVVLGVQEWFYDGISVTASTGELLGVVDWDDAVRVSRKLPERLPVGQHVDGGRSNALVHELPDSSPYQLVLIVVGYCNCDIHTTSSFYPDGTLNDT